METMESYIAKVATIAVKYNRGDMSPSMMATYFDYEILDILIEFVVKNDDHFFSYSKSIELEDLKRGHWGYFSNAYGFVVVNEELVKGLTKRLVIGSGTAILRQLVNTVLHEHRHAYQRRHKLSMCDVPYISADVDYEAYYNHPTEVDARQYADEYTEEALMYLYAKLKKKFVTPIADELRKESTI